MLKNKFERNIPKILCPPTLCHILKNLLQTLKTNIRFNSYLLNLIKGLALQLPELMREVIEHAKHT